MSSVKIHYHVQWVHLGLVTALTRCSEVCNKKAQTLTCSTSDLSGVSMSFELNSSSGCLPLKYGQWPDSINERNIAEGPFPRIKFTKVYIHR